MTVCVISYRVKGERMDTMSKTITIPTDLGYENSMTVYINGKSYTYTPGDTVQVPDEVAALISDMERQQEKDQKAASGQPDWNENDQNSPAYIRNRPFYAFGNAVVTIPDKYIPTSVAREEDLDALAARVTALEARVTALEGAT